MSQTAAAAREPLLRIAKREGTTMPQKIAVRAIAIILALVVDAVFIFFVTGLNPLAVYGVMWGGTFANMTRFSWMLRDLSTLLCVGIALAPAFKMRFWNCGGEGQILIGGLTAALIMVYQGNNLPLPLLFAAMAGGSAPSRISRMTPPPTLVTAPSTSAPSTSSSRAAATITPETANAAIPTISSTKISVSISFMRLFRYI